MQSITADEKIPENPSNDDALSTLHIDRSFITLSKDTVTTSVRNYQRTVTSISDDKLHRRNPVAVRQEIQSYDDLIPETNLYDLQLNEMPGLQNPEQWKRIAGRIGQTSPPLSRQYYQTATNLPELQNYHLPEVSGSSRRSGRVENEQAIPVTSPSLFKNPRRKVLIGCLFLIIISVILTAVVTAVILVRKPKQKSTDFYAGSIFVRTHFDPMLLSLSSTLAKNYQKEFCSLIGTALIDTKTKYAIFYSDCNINNFRNGSTIGDFILGFTRYQNVTRLNAFLTRTLVSKQLFGGAILSIMLNSTTDNATNNTDYTTF